PLKGGGIRWGSVAMTAHRAIKSSAGWEADERPEPRSLGLLPSGPDPVGEWLVHRQPPGRYIGRAGRESKLAPLLHPPPRSAAKRSGGGGPSGASDSERRMVEGARAVTKLLHRKRSGESEAPSTILLRKMVPLPRAMRREG